MASQNLLNIGPGDNLLPDGSIPVPEPMLTNHQWGPVPYTWWQSLQWRHNGPDDVSNHQPHDCLLNRLFRHRPKKTSKLRVTGLCAGNSPVTGEFPAQRGQWRGKCFHLMTSSWSPKSILDIRLKITNFKVATESPRDQWIKTMDWMPQATMKYNGSNYRRPCDYYRIQEYWS